jgi:hypothetical protein
LLPRLRRPFGRDLRLGVSRWHSHSTLR